MQTAVRFPRLLGGDFGEVRRLHPASLSLELQRRSCSKAQLVLPEEEGQLPFLAFLELYTAKGSAGLYRVTNTSEPTAGSRTYTLRHAIDTLRDSRWKAQDYDFSGTMQAFLAALLSEQNVRYWQLGVCADTGHYSREGINYDSLDELLDEVRQDRNDYIFTYDFTTTPWTLNFVPSSGAAVDCELRLTRNLAEGQLRRTRDGMCNILHLSVSTTVEDETTVTYHTYREENSIAQFGPIEGTAGVDAGEVPNPAAWAQTFLRDHAWPIVQASADGFELVKATGEAWDALDIGKTARLAVARDGFPAAFPIETLRYEQLFGDTPEKVRADLNRPLPRFSEALAKAREKAEKAGRSAGGAGRKLKEQEKKFKKFETFYTQTDEKFSWLATESEWDELAQAGHVTAFTELTRTARYVEDSAKMELSYEDWKGQWLVAHPEDSELTDPELQEKYSEWIKENPYAIYNTAYSDATRTERIISKTGIDSLGENETVLSRITQEADRVESSVYASQSQVYSAIGQTASNIRVELTNTEQNLYNYINMTASGIRQQITNAGNRTIVNDTDPRGATYTPKEGDIWIESVHDGTWDGADGFDWEHDEDYDWTQVQGAKAWVWKNDQWQLVADRQQLVTYSDFVNTADILISQKISELANEQGQVEVYRSLIEQSAESIRAEVYGATSNIYTYIHQTASSVSIAAGQRPTTVVQNSHTDGTPTSINGRGLKENDIWIDTADQDSWDAALDFNWNDDLDYNWNDLRSDKIYVYRNGAWQLAVDGTILAEDTDLQVERDRIALLARNIDTLDGYARENFAQVNVRANEIYSEVLDKTSNLGSSIAQTATQIRSEVHAANSQIYSEIVQTASNILLHVENAVSDLGATLEVTASQIRSDVYATQSSVYSSIVQTASQIRSEVVSTTSSLRSSITQTASQIRSEVASTSSSLRSLIKQNADSIELKVSKGDVASTINQTAQSVLISASKINLEGYVTATELDAEKARFDNLTAGRTKVSALKATTIEADYVYGAQVFYNGSSLGGAIRSCSASSSNGIITLTFTKYNTDTLTVNFNMADTAYFKNAVSAARASSLSTITLGSSDTGTSTQTVTVYSDDDEEIDLNTTVDASAVYEAGKTDAHAEYTYHTGYLRGSSVSVTPVGNTSYLMNFYGNTTLYKKNGDNYESVGAHPWYYVGSGGTRLYVAGSSTTYYTSGGFISYYTRNIS